MSLFTRTQKYPIDWEIFIDAVYMDGQKLNSSSLASSDIAVSGLVDTVSVLNCHTHSPWLKRVPGKLSCPRPFRCHRRDLQPAGWDRILLFHSSHARLSDRRQNVPY